MRRFLAATAGIFVVLVGVVAGFAGGTGLAQSPPPLPTIDPSASPEPFNPEDLPFTREPGLKITPTRYEENLEPGKPKDGVVDVFNVGREPITVQPEVENIRMVGDNGDLAFYIGDNPYRLHNFVQIDRAPFVLGVGEARRIKFRIAVPAGVFPGGYFGALLFRIVPPEQGGEGSVIRQGGRVGSLLIFTVEGDSDRRGEITEATLTGNGFDDEKTFALTYQNTGNTDGRPLGVAYRPKGKVVIKNMLGLKAAEKDLEGEIVFPGAKRKLDARHIKPLWFGRYTAEFTLGPGQEDRVDTKRVTFWAISPMGLVAALLILLAAAGTAWWLLRRRAIAPTPPGPNSLLDEIARAHNTEPPADSTPAQTRPDDPAPEFPKPPEQPGEQRPPKPPDSNSGKPPAG